MSSFTLTDVVGLIYDAPLSGDWTVTLSAIRQQFACGHVVLMQHDPVLGVDLPVGSGDQSIEARYVDHYAPFNNAWPRLMRHGVGEPATDAMLLDLEAHRRSMFFNEFLQPNDMISMAGCVLFRLPTMTAGISLSRPANREPFVADDLRSLKPIAGHLSRALRLKHRLSQAEHAANNAWAMLEQLRVGLVVVDAQARLLQANHAAESTLRTADGLALRRGRLTAIQNSQNEALYEAIDRCTSRVAYGGADEAIRLDRSSGRLPYLVDVLPLQGPPDWVGSTRTSCAVFITDLDKSPRPLSGTLQRVLGLTPAEAAVALQIGDGDNLSGVAARLGVGLATVRTHLAHVLDKAGMHRQAELARFVERVAGSLQDDSVRSPPNG